jgi:MFS family permease
MFSLNVLTYGLVAPFAGGLGDRWKPHRTMPLGIAILGVAMAGCAFARELWHFYLLFGILAPIGTAFTGWPLLSGALTNWFAKIRGVVLAIGQIGVGLSFAYGMFAEFVISRLGWRHAYFVLAGSMVALLLPLYLFLFHYRPEERGMLAYGAGEGPSVKDLTAEGRPEESSEVQDLTLGNALKSHRLWLLVSSFFLFWGIGGYLVLAHQVKFAQDAGYSGMFAASVFGLFGIFMVAGQLSSSISDWIGRELTILFASILGMGALFALISVKDTSQPWLLYCYAICFGYGGGLYAPTIFVGAADIFSGRDFGAISGLLLTGMGTGGAVGPWLGGYIYDISGSYRVALILSMVGVGLGCIAFFIAAPRKGFTLSAKT